MSCLPHHENVSWNSPFPLWVASAGYFVPAMRKVSPTRTILSVSVGHKRLISLLREALSFFFFFLTARYVAAILKQWKRITEGDSSLGDPWELADALVEWRQHVGLPWFNDNICIGQALSLVWAGWTMEQAWAVAGQGALSRHRMKKNCVSTCYFCPYKFLIFFSVAI